MSKGMKQKLAIVIAFMHDPDILILDEPTSGLDPLQRIEVRGLIQELTAEHTVLLSSHILAEVEAVCPRVIILDRGRVAADGTPEELVRELGQESRVRLEAVVPDPAQAAELLRSLPGVDRVVEDGRLGIHWQFDVFGPEDLREDVGALAAAKGWALRELSWRRPTLEQIFASIALHMPLDPAEERPPAAPAAPAPSDKLVYNLDPFAGGASRELDAPVAPGSAARPAAPTLNPFENFGASVPPTPSTPPPRTLNPFEGFGAGAPPTPPADEAEDTRDADRPRSDDQA
jgi:hypothetical protein